jgi:hypothetical protein
LQKGDREQDQKNHPHDCPAEWMSFEKKIRRHTANKEKPKNDNQRVAGCLCNARKIDHLMFPKSPIYSGAMLLSQGARR